MHIRDRSLATTAGAREDGGVDLEPAHLRSFLAVVDYGGYHRAAEALHLTQPAVSQHVRRLEQRVGGPLFERRGRGGQGSARGEAGAPPPGAPPAGPGPAPSPPGRPRAPAV